MAIQIRLITNGDSSSESKAAFQLKVRLENELRTAARFASGEILLISNVTLFGQETKDIDIAMIGKFSNFKLPIVSIAKDKNSVQLPEIQRETYINSFCYVIEVKDHNYSGVRQQGVNLLVKYNEKWSDATSQSEKQKYALKSFLTEHLDFSPTICNFIWLRNISSGELLQLNQNHKDNLLPSAFSLAYIITKSTFQYLPYKPENQNYGILNCTIPSNFELFDLNSLEKVFNLFTEVRNASGELTRLKIEQITSATLDKQQYAQSIGNKLTVIAGRSGKGKTVRLLRIACDLAVNSGKRSLIFTYNHALVTLRRTLTPTLALYGFTIIEKIELWINQNSSPKDSNKSSLLYLLS